MEIHVVEQSVEKTATPALLVTVFEKTGELEGAAKAADKILDGQIKALMDSGEIKGRFKEYTILHAPRAPIERVIVIGLGEKAAFTADRVRSVTARGARIARRIHLSQLTVASSSQGGLAPEVWAAAAVEGALLGLYRFHKYKTGQDHANHAVGRLVLMGEKGQAGALNKGAERGRVLAEAIMLARDLVNEPAATMTPSILAAKAAQVAEELHLGIDVLDTDRMEALGMGALLAVARGSREPAKLIVLRYEGKPGAPVLGLVGKGITFDSGGLSLKDADNMFRMHCDMAGSAAVLSAVKAIATLKIPINVLGIMPATENLPDGKAYKPGDIVTSMTGKTIEVLNTDAEGRLILADGLAYARTLGVDALVDLATLTGACVVALGHAASGLMGNRQEWIDEVKAAAGEASEKVWQLPLFDEYMDQIRSDVADLENTGGRPAGAQTAGIFLKQFVGDTPWAHLDIAGTAYIEKLVVPYSWQPYLPKEGATGAGVRTLVRLAERLSDEKAFRALVGKPAAARPKGKRG